MSYVVAFAGLGFAGFGALYRLLVGPSLADRVIALDLALITLMAGIAVDAARRDDPTFLNLLVVIAIIGFTATVATTRFIERNVRHRRPGPPSSAVDSAIGKTSS